MRQLCTGFAILLLAAACTGGTEPTTTTLTPTGPGGGETTATTTSGFTGPTDTTPPQFGETAVVPLAEGFGVVCSGAGPQPSSWYATLEGPWTEPGAEFDAVTAFYEDFLTGEGFEVRRMLDEPKWVALDAQEEDGVASVTVRPTMHSTLVIAARATERSDLKGVAGEMNAQDGCWGSDEVIDAASGVYRAYGGEVDSARVGDPLNLEPALSFHELLAGADLPWQHDGWSIGTASVNLAGQPSRFLEVSRGALDAFSLELLHGCLDAPFDGPAFTEQGVQDFWDEIAADRDRLAGDHTYTLDLRAVEVQGRPGFTTLWTHTHDGRLEEASVQLWLISGNENCSLFAPGGDSDHRPQFDSQLVIDFAPFFDAFVDDLDDLITGRGPGLVSDDPEEYLDEIFKLRASAGTGRIVGFVHLTGDASTGPPDSPTQPVCTGAGDFADIKPGAVVFISDNAEQELAAAILRGSGFDGHIGCGLWFGADVPDANSYTIAIGSHSAEPVNTAQLATSAWIVDLWGDPGSLAANCAEASSEPQTCVILASAN